MWIDPVSNETHSSLDFLRSKYLNISFPSELGENIANEFGLLPVIQQEPPAFDLTLQIVEEQSPLLIDGSWYQQWLIRDLTPEELFNNIPKRVTKLQGMLAIAEVGLSNSFITWKNSLDPIADFSALAFLESAKTWEYDNELLNAALEQLGISSQKDYLFKLASTL